MKPLSHRRATEFRGRFLKRMFGDSKKRAERRLWLIRRYGHALFLQEVMKWSKSRASNSSRPIQK